MAILNDDLAGERGVRAAPAGLPARRRQAPTRALLPHDDQPLRSGGRKIRGATEAKQVRKLFKGSAS